MKNLTGAFILKIVQTSTGLANPDEMAFSTFST